MEPPIFNRLARDFGDRGLRAAQLLRTAETLVASPPSGPRIGEVIAYCIREALVEIPRAANINEGRWKSISREVVDASTRYQHARGLAGMEEQKALEDLLVSIDDLVAFHNHNSIHVEGLREIIRLQSGVDPLTHDANALTDYQKLIRDIQGMVHTSANVDPVTVEDAGQCLQRAIDAMSRLFLVDPRMERLQQLSALENPTGNDVETLRANLITPHDLRFFASSVISPIWLDLMMDQGLLEPPADQNGIWLAATMLDRLRDGHGEAIADWLERAWGRWSATEQGLIALAFAAHETGESGREVLLSCLKTRSDIPAICRFARWEIGNMDTADPHVAAFADLLLNPAGALDRHDTEDVLDAVVAGIDRENGITRISLLVHKLSARMGSGHGFYIDDHMSIASADEERLHNLDWSFLRAIVQSLRKAIELNLAFEDLASAVKGLPQEVGDHIQAWIRANAKDVDCNESIEFVAEAIQVRHPTTDDVLLVDSIAERCGLGSAADLWQGALGPPPDPVTLGTIVRQQPGPDDLIRRWLWSVVLPLEVAGSWSESQAILDSALGSVKKDDWLRPRARSTIMSGPNSPFDTPELESKPPMEVADRIAAWRPTSADSWEMRSARGVGRQLERIVKNDPRRWADSPVEMVARLRHPTYIAHFFSGLKEDAESLADVSDRVIEAIGFARTHPWPAAPMGGDSFDADLDWNPTDTAGVDLIKALAEKHIPLGEDATRRAWVTVIDATRDRGEPSGLLDDDRDPLNSAINRPCTRALETIVALIEYERRRSGVVPPEALAVLSESLELEGRDGAAHRAILAPRIPFLRFALPEWFDENLNLMLGNSAPPDLAQKTVDLWLRWGRANEWMLNQFRPQILDAVRRESERAMEGFLLGMYWDIPGYDAVSCIHDLSNFGPEYVSASGESVARMAPSEDTEIEILRRGIAFWEEVLRTAPGKEALRGFGWWAEVQAIPPDQWENLTLQTCEQSKGDIDWAAGVAERASSRPASAKSLRILTLLVRAPLEIWEKHRVAEHALKALKESPKHSSLTDERDELRKVLLERGYFGARDVP